MTQRSPVKTNVQKQLWAEAMGHCMNPECGKELMRIDTNVGQMAHIVPDAEGGDVSFENLLLLCLECHKLIDDKRTEDTVSTLKQWKMERNNFIRHNFSEQYQSFSQLKEVVVPILERNYQIFKGYGPINQDLRDSERHNLWLRFEPEIIFNNAKLEIILLKNKTLFHRNYHNIVEMFVSHIREFVETREIEEAISDKPVPNVAALQNFISHLGEENRFYRFATGTGTNSEVRGRRRDVHPRLERPAKGAADVLDRWIYRLKPRDFDWKVSSFFLLEFCILPYQLPGHA